MMEWQMTPMQIAALQDIHERKLGLDEVLMGINRQAAGIRNAEVKWWKQVIVELGIPQEYAERLQGNTQTGKVTLLEKGPQLVVPGRVGKG